MWYDLAPESATLGQVCAVWLCIGRSYNPFDWLRHEVRKLEKLKLHFNKQEEPGKVTKKLVARQREQLVTTDALMSEKQSEVYKLETIKIWI